MVQSDSINQNNDEELLKNSVKIGKTTMNIEKDTLEALKQEYNQNPVIKVLNFQKNSSDSESIGAITVEFTLKLGNLELQFIQSNLQIQDCYYDPFVNDSQVIIDKLNKVNKLTDIKIKELDRLYK